MSAPVVILDLNGEYRLSFQKAIKFDGKTVPDEFRYSPDQLKEGIKRSKQAFLFLVYGGSSLQLRIKNESILY